MDLTAVLRRAAARRPHVLVVPVPGATAVRLAVEAELAGRRWPIATSPADADLLVVAGAAGPEMSAVVDGLWGQIPAPRARTVVEAAGRLTDPFDEARARLATGSDACACDGGPDGGGDHDGHDGGGMDLPGGLGMADLGADRDGLTLDRLHVPLGPALPDWPAGVVLRVTLQGDVIQEAAVEVLDPVGGPGFWADPARATARELDGLARFLAVAGWSAAATRARRLRDETVDGGSADRTVLVRDLVRRVRRSRTLRWSLSGTGTGDLDLVEVVERRLGAVEAAASGERPGGPRPPLAELPDLLVGAELAVARLLVAALDPDPEAAAGERESAHG